MESKVICMRVKNITIAITFIVFLAMGLWRNAAAEKLRSEVIIITIGSMQFDVELYDTADSRSLLRILPQTINMSKWGYGEYYGKLSKDIEYKGDVLREVWFIRQMRTRSCVGCRV